MRTPETNKIHPRFDRIVKTHNVIAGVEVTVEVNPLWFNYG
jgi:hypothetical protein